MKNDITMAKPDKSIKKLKKKSPGPDYVTNEMLQHLGNTTKQTLLDIYNLSRRYGQVPQCWKEATIISVLKKGRTGQSQEAKTYRIPGFFGGDIILVCFCDF
jgi:hypothetical protein